MAHCMYYKSKCLNIRSIPKNDTVSILLLFLPRLLKVQRRQAKFWARSLGPPLSGPCLGSSFSDIPLLQYPIVSPAQYVIGISSNSRCSFMPTKLRTRLFLCLECSPHVVYVTISYSLIQLWRHFLSASLNEWMDERMNEYFAWLCDLRSNIPKETLSVFTVAFPNALCF